MPCNYRRDYPPDWHEFSLRIREARADWRCECRGECRKVHHFRGSNRCRLQQDEKSPRGSRVVLTVAHLDYVGGICRCEAKCDIESHVMALCQGCHLRMDMPKHMARQRRNRLAKAGQQTLPEVPR